jgi:Dolichyl-phosphate-mannose-protein mannosyltransferase
MSTIGKLSTALGWTAVSWAMILGATIAVASTARVFSGTVDEPAHLAAGMQWLTTGQYSYDLQHPPLGRIAAALGPYAHGARSTNDPAVYDEGAKILGSGSRYSDMLASARHGELVFFVLLAVVVWLWARGLVGDAGAAIATLLLVANPNVLAHAGLATTDIACAATTTLALFLAVRWVESPTMSRALAFGAGAALAVGSRLSALAFVGGALVVCYGLYAWVARRATIERARGAPSAIAQVGASAALFVVAIWGIYRFAVGPMHPGGASVPAPAFLAGVDTFLLHGSSGHPSFLLGTPANRGWWYYFPVALAVKTPIPLLLLSIVGAAVAFGDVKARRDWRTAVPIAAALTMLAISTTVRVDLGVRLILPMYPLLAIVAAQGAMRLWSERPAMAPRAMVGALLAWSLVIVVRAHPDHLSYFNALAGDHPERILVDSNLDWGQDLYRLRDTIIARRIRDTVRVAYFGTADLSAAGVPNARELGLHERATGWIAASETYLAGEWVGRAYDWLLDYPPVARVGPSMRLWYIPAPEAGVTTDSSRRSAR